MELVGKKFRVKDDSEDIVYLIEESKVEDEYVISWMYSEADEVEECLSNYKKEHAEEYVSLGWWILENE